MPEYKKKRKFSTILMILLFSCLLHIVIILLFFSQKIGISPQKSSPKKVQQVVIQLPQQVLQPKIGKKGHQFNVKFIQEEMPPANTIKQIPTALDIKHAKTSSSVIVLNKKQKSDDKLTQKERPIIKQNKVCCALCHIAS